MVSDGDVLYREWVPGPAGARGWLFGATLSFAAMVGSASLAWRGGWLAIPAWIVAIVAAALLFTAINFRGLLIVVDRRGIAWSFGLLRRRYAHAEIQMFREREFGFVKGGVGGWGIGLARDGMDEYQVWGANGSALDLVVKRGGVAKHYLVSTAAPEWLAAALVRADATVPRSAPASP